MEVSGGRPRASCPDPGEPRQKDPGMADWGPAGRKVGQEVGPARGLGALGKSPPLRSLCQMETLWPPPFQRDRDREGEGDTTCARARDALETPQCRARPQLSAASADGCC